jgi:glycine oxidase
MQPGYLVPRGDGRYVLGATMEERGFDVTVTAGPIHDLLRDAIEMVPGVREFMIDEVVAGIRPGTPDNAPLIGAGALEGLYWATGHHRHGILLAPVTAEIIAQALSGALGSAADSAGAGSLAASGTGPASPVPDKLTRAFEPRRFTRAEQLAVVR